MTVKNRIDKTGPAGFRRSPLGIFASYYRPHWKLFAADMICASFIAAVDLAFPVMTRYSIGSIAPGAAAADSLSGFWKSLAASKDSGFRLFVIMVAAMMAIHILRMVFSWFVTYWGHTVGAYIEADMRRDLFDHLQTLPFSFYDNHRTGHIMSRVTNDLFEITELAHHGPEDLFISFLTLSGSFVILLFMRWEMALVLLLALPLLIVHTMKSRKRMMGASRQVKEKTAEINASLESSISGARVAKAFTNESYEKQKFRGGNEHFIGAKKSFYKSMASFHSRLEFILHIFNVIVIAAGGLLIMAGRMNLVELITCTLFAAAILQPVRRLANFVEQYTTGMAGFSRFVELMREEPDVKDRPDAVTLSGVRGDIEYRDVSFSYNRDVTVLKHINLRIKAGSTLALVGPSGGGKTTLCHLLPRFYEIREGSVTIDGTDIRDITLKSLRKNIGIVQQDVFLFAGTLRENIAYGSPGATEAEIIAAAKKAEIHGDIVKLPEGYESHVGERGIKLSGGQKQRISIARIFLKNPPILILDEATSALDSATEKKIQRALEELARGRTTLVIAHRLSTIRNAGTIAVIDDEGIRQIGSHSKLLAEDGLYAELYRAQFSRDY
ncbi:MAG: ABC transporter ATP-binding protein/permease [Treponema sp.]|jgi:ATP-binding cassette subfamily B protein|nr:ABC transporter ATP-binding protein/permease [Treponema sp.]